jgi:hypothetical protein
LKLRSKFTLLLLVGAVLLAAPAMALITDTGPNILPSPTSQSDKANIDALAVNRAGTRTVTRAVTHRPRSRAVGRT